MPRTTGRILKVTRQGAELETKCLRLPFLAASQHQLDAAYCYRHSSVVCLSVCQSVGRSVTVLSPAKTAQLIEMPFWLWARVGSRNHALDGVQTSYSTMGKDNLVGEKGGPL